MSADRPSERLEIGLEDDMGAEYNRRTTLESRTRKPARLGRLARDSKAPDTLAGALGSEGLGIGCQ